jgi:hypothetical protein
VIATENELRLFPLSFSFPYSPFYHLSATPSGYSMEFKNFIPLFILEAEECRELKLFVTKPLSTSPFIENLEFRC